MLFVSYIHMHILQASRKCSHDRGMRYLGLSNWTFENAFGQALREFVQEGAMEKRAARYQAHVE